MDPAEVRKGLQQMRLQDLSTKSTGLPREKLEQDAPYPVHVGCESSLGLRKGSSIGAVVMTLGDGVAQFRHCTKISIPSLACFVHGVSQHLLFPHRTRLI